MPIKPENKQRYPSHWRVIRQSVLERAALRCECTGQCGLHRERRCVERHGERALWARGKIVLTIAHLDHTPEHCKLDNLRALCQRCHLRYDAQHHVRTARQTRWRQRNNLELFDVEGGAA